MSEEDATQVTTEWRELMGRDVLMRTVERGAEGPCAEMGVLVVCRDVQMTCVDPQTETETLVDSIDLLRSEIGKGDVVPGLELALRHSRAGDLIQVRVASKFGYGDPPANHCLYVAPH
jgi:hypothetical protein